MPTHRTLLSSMLGRCSCLAAALVLSSCAGSGTRTTVPGPYDDCVLSSPTGEVPEDVYRVVDVAPSSEWSGFSKSMEVYGITLVAGDDIPDEFLRAIAETIREMFSSEAPELDEQAKVLGKLHAHRAVIPVLRDAEQLDEAAIDAITSQASVCDIIMLDVPERQAMEVLEHVLHIVSDVGLHLSYPEEWGLSEHSALYSSSREAHAAGAYALEQYDDIDEGAVRERVVLQEYAYWILTSYWDLQREHGPQEDEWTARTPAQLEARVPSASALIEATAARVMVGPSAATMDALEAW